MGKAHRSGKESDCLAVASTWRLPARRELKARAKRPIISAGMAAEANLSSWLSSCRVLRRFGGCCGLMSKCLL
eukprot:10533.XXX_267250_267468_1 [CDS] Oithona nana genome sequencing.